MHKNKRFELRVNGFELEILKTKAASSGQSLSSYLVNCGLDKRIKSRFTAEELELYMLLKKYETNFKRIANLYHNDRNKDSQVLKEQIKEVIQSIKNLLQ